MTLLWDSAILIEQSVLYISGSLGARKKPVSTYPGTQVRYLRPIGIRNSLEVLSSSYWFFSGSESLTAEQTRAREPGRAHRGEFVERRGKTSENLLLQSIPRRRSAPALIYG